MAVVLFSGCAHEFNQVYKSTDYLYKYEFAKECFANGKYMQAGTLLQDVVTMQKGTTAQKKASTCWPCQNFATRTTRAHP